MQAPPAEHVSEVRNATTLKDPPRYESQLKRKGGSTNVEADADAAEALDQMIDRMEKEIGYEEGKDAKLAAKAKAPKAKAKSKSKAKAKPKASSKSKGDDLEEPGPVNEDMDLPDYKSLDGDDDQDAEDPEPKAKATESGSLNQACEDPEALVPYPQDPYEPPVHVTTNHIYSNCYKRALVSGLTKEAAADAARTQTMVFRAHAVVSKSMVGTFRAPKGTNPKKKK